MRKDYTLLMGVVLAAMLAIPAFADTARGRIKHVDADKSTITVTVRAGRQAPGQDTDFTVTGDTKYLNVKGDALADGLKSADLKEGALVTLTTDTKDGKTVVTQVQLRAPRAPRNGGGNGGGGAAPATPAK